MIDIIVWGVIIIVAIGVIVVGIPILGLAIWLWWLLLPLLGAYFGGWIGFFFGVGLDVVIGIVYLGIKGIISESKPKSNDIL